MRAVTVRILHCSISDWLPTSASMSTSKFVDSNVWEEFVVPSIRSVVEYSACNIRLALERRGRVLFLQENLRVVKDRYRVETIKHLSKSIEDRSPHLRVRLMYSSVLRR